MISIDLLQKGEAIHGSSVEKEILDYLANLFQGSKKLPVNTMEWNITYEKLYINGKEVPCRAMPYTRGHVSGKVGDNILAFPFPDHPFKVKDFFKYSLSVNAEGIIFYGDKLRRVKVSEDIVKVPTVTTTSTLKKGDEVEIHVDSWLRNTTSYNVEYTVNEGEESIVIGAHVDHWLTGFHDNLLALDVINGLKGLKLNRKGLKFVFFSSEEGPKCCTGSSQYPKKGIFASIILDALYPNRVVYSSTPDLWQFANYFRLKRIEMPTRYSDDVSFVEENIPSLTLYNDDLIPFYHSDRDLQMPEDLSYIEELKLALIKMLKALDNVKREELDERLKSFGFSKRELGS
ncbi:MAG: M28 family peptidase [Sulfolobaceae archaeon]|nr:M28 family peptidase [Sulfolobaceae archaeon]